VLQARRTPNRVFFILTLLGTLSPDAVKGSPKGFFIKMTKIKIKDESGDRKYFTQIPNIIVNHSTAYEQSLYLIMKRIAGEGGSCFASLNTLAGRMGANRKTVAKNIIKLVDRKWIEEIEPIKIRGGIVKQFKIVDLWKLNMEEYESGAKRDRVEESGAIIPEVGLKGTSGGAKRDTKKNLEEEHKKNLATTSVASEEIVKLIEFFEVVNPSIEKYYGNKTQRASAERMIKKHGLEKLEIIVKALPQINAKPYWPKSTTPCQLEDNFGKYKALSDTEKSKVEKNKSKIAFV